MRISCIETITLLIYCQLHQYMYTCMSIVQFCYLQLWNHTVITLGVKYLPSNKKLLHYKGLWPIHCDHFWSIVLPCLSSNHSWFIHQNSLAVTSRHLIAKQEETWREWTPVSCVSSLTSPIPVNVSDISKHFDGRGSKVLHPFVIQQTTSLSYEACCIHNYIEVMLLFISFSFLIMLHVFLQIPVSCVL
jgi:hypothetical protein